VQTQQASVSSGAFAAPRLKSPAVLPTLGPRLTSRHNPGPETEKKSILVPLTNSLYVRGALTQPDRVLVDIGTGFYVEKVTERSRVSQPLVYGPGRFYAALHGIYRAEVF